MPLLANWPFDSRPLTSRVAFMATSSKLAAMPLSIRPYRRLSQLMIGLMLYGASMGLMIESRLGLDPWDVFHQGVARRTGLRFGWVVIAVGAIVLLLWIPLRQRPGLGTISNVIVIGLAVDATLAVLPTPSAMGWRATFAVVGIVGNGMATGLYIGARLGPGPRDGLMTGLAARGHSIRLVRTGIELTVLAIGWMLGGTVGIATVLYAVSIGPLAQLFIEWLRVPTSERRARPEPEVDHAASAIQPAPSGHTVADPTRDSAGEQRVPTVAQHP
jgi:uncharacterized membrane protein YczE